MVLDGHAFDIYEGCPPENGLEAWRRFMRDHTKRTPAETFRLEEPALHPHKCDKQSELPQHIVKWEAAVRRYHESLPATSPDRLSERRQVYALMRILPQTIRDKVIWEKKHEGTVEELKTWVLEQVRETAGWSTKPPGVHVVESEELQEELQGLGDEASEQEVMAVVKRFMKGRPTKTTSRDPKDMTCPNCLAKRHGAKECRKPKLAMKDRGCFHCHKTGHLARDCLERKELATKALEAETYGAEAARQAQSATTFCLEAKEER